MSITFPNVFANSAGGNQPASELDANFTYTTTLAASAPPAGGLSGTELVLLSQGGNPVSSTITQFAASIGIGLAAQAVILQTGQTFGVSGDASGTSTAFNGSASCTIPITLVVATTATAGKVALATGAQVITGTDATHAVTPASLTSQQLANANGYVTFPGGIILQWGHFASGSWSGALQAVTFPLAFPTACLNVTGITDNASAVGSPHYGLEVASAITTTGVSFRAVGYQSGAPANINGFYWLAIGH